MKATNTKVLVLKPNKIMLSLTLFAGKTFFGWIAVGVGGGSLVLFGG